MLKGLKKLLLGDPNGKELKRLTAIVARINAYESEIAGLTDEELRAKTAEFQAKIKAGSSLDDVLPEAFAVVREAAGRVLGMRHYDVQLMGGIALHEGKIAEMKTGEGKTLVATSAAYLNALSGKGVHIVTVNDYLAKRDSEWMGQIYRFLGLEVGLILHETDYEERKAAYNADITFGTNNEFGFDYLRDNMVYSEEQMVQRPLNYAIVDEVDSILIDEARTPLIISGVGDKPTSTYYSFARLVERLKPEEDYQVDEKAHAVSITEAGVAKTEKMLGVDNLYEDIHMDLVHYLNQALRAKALMKREKDYVVMDGKVVIVDEFTGRLMEGRRYSDGLHQAIEAKEGLKIENESQTLASITFQNYFRMYKKLSGMTGTAKTEEDEFVQIYGLEVVVIPTNKPMQRIDNSDVVYKNIQAKYKAVIEEIVEKHKLGQPVLVGTVSIEKSEQLSNMLKKRGVPHHVLNAKYHAREAEIIKDAGQKGAVTIATNMAGRGTDIVLGEGVTELGGLHIIGTERHESRRIDNQLRGRSGRQGDPGSSRFYLSLEDDLMRVFGSDNIAGLLDKLGFEEDEPIEHRMITRAIESAQKKVEAKNFSIRKQVLSYDDVMNKQREVIYQQRQMVLKEPRLKAQIIKIMEDVLQRNLDCYLSTDLHQEEWSYAEFIKSLEHLFLPEGRITVEQLEELPRDEIKQLVMEQFVSCYEQKEADFGSEQMAELEKGVMLKVIDSKWIEHLQMMDTLREGIGWRAYAQVDPLVAYKKESFQLFQELMENIQEDLIYYLFRIEIVREMPKVQTRELHYSGEEEQVKQPVHSHKIGRNDPCPCGSGKKYKKCCGA